ncbi:hypothetical protein [Limnothrix sp. FACHB-406]|uniref:hypothetical protein n=1 Tax=Limnothrix sp. FACHB-406 TaxID=2692817 RepID=UPI001686CC3F|nr:hypothetical protein [Limnothrix sp. FACHB-406]
MGRSGFRHGSRSDGGDRAGMLPKNKHLGRWRRGEGLEGRRMLMGFGFGDFWDLWRCL